MNCIASFRLKSIRAIIARQPSSLSEFPLRPPWNSIKGLAEIRFNPNSQPFDDQLTQSAFSATSIAQANAG